MKVNLEYITPNAEETIGRYAAICYDANVESSACIRRAAKCARDGHLATLRFAHATFRVTGISRVCSHQFVRSKHLDFLQQSQRYVNSQAHSFVYPENAHAHIYASSYMHSMNLYNKLIDQGVRKEDARFVLPAGIATELVVVGNLQAWKDFIHLRLDKAAQWEIRQVALEVNNHLAHACPNLFNERET